MADWVQVIALALIQGVTEFLPVSSSAHLILPTEILGWDDQGLLFDVGVHAGTLCAVLWHFRETILSWAMSAMPGGKVDRSEMWAVVVGTLPAVLAGLVLKDVIASGARAAAAGPTMDPTLSDDRSCLAACLVRGGGCAPRGLSIAAPADAQICSSLDCGSSLRVEMEAFALQLYGYAL